MTTLPISPLSLHQLTRDYWGQFDAAAIASLAPLSEETCYQPKFYKAPDLQGENLPALGYINYGMKVSVGSILYGFYLPPSPNTSLPAQFNVQITDVSLNHQFFDEPQPSIFCGNYNATYISPAAASPIIGSFPHLFVAPHPVVGSGLFRVEIWETSGVAQRIELVFGALEVVE